MKAAVACEHMAAKGVYPPDRTVPVVKRRRATNSSFRATTRQLQEHDQRAERRSRHVCIAPAQEYVNLGTYGTAVKAAVAYSKLAWRPRASIRMRRQLPVVKEAEAWRLFLSSNSETGYKHVYKPPSGRFEVHYRQDPWQGHVHRHL